VVKDKNMVKEPFWDQLTMMGAIMMVVGIIGLFINYRFSILGWGAGMVLAGIMKYFLVNR
jgi:hypothetical protein